MTRRLLALALVVALSACSGLRSEDNDHPLADDEVPYDLLAGPTTTTTEPPAPTTTTLPWRTNLWYIAGGRAVQAPRQLVEQPDVAQVLRLLLNGPSDDDQPLVRSALDAGDAAIVGRPAGGTLTIALQSDFGARSPTEQVLALAQLVLTVTEVPGVGRVAFRIGDADIAVPLPNGQLAEGSVSRDDYLVLAVPSA
jgi:spore germination protein GerM